MITKGKEPTVYLQFEVHTHERASGDYFVLTRQTRQTPENPDQSYSPKYHDLANIIQRTCMTYGPDILRVVIPFLLGVTLPCLLRYRRALGIQPRTEHARRLI